jgi:rubrerythrin
VCRSFKELTHSLARNEKPALASILLDHVESRADHAFLFLTGVIDSNPGGDMKIEQLNELLYQSLETELGGVQVYTTALKCAVNEELKEEWEEYLEQTQKHVEIMERTIEELGLDTSTETPGRKVVRHIGESLVKAMEMALQSGNSAAAQLVAAECVTHAETKDHLNWELIGEAAKKLKGEEAKVLKAAFEEVEEEEDEHLYHTTGWTRELWIESLGLPAVLPPPEEEKDVKTAIGAARAKQARGSML